MRKENLTHGFISFVIIMPLLLFSCTAEGKELNRKDVEKILTNHLQKQLSWRNNYMCKLSDSWTKKSEFIQLKNVYFCTFKPTVTGIRKISENTAIVEYRMESIYDKKSLKKILDGSEKLQTRYAMLKPINKRQITEEEKRINEDHFAMSESKLSIPIIDLSSRLIYVWEFKDPIEGDVFFSDVADDDIGNIKKTTLWQGIEYIKKVCKDYMANNIGNKRESGYTASFALYDDGWRIIDDGMRP